MAHFALLDNTDTVLMVIKLSNEDVNNLDFPESEPVGIEALNFIYNNENNNLLEEMYPEKTGFYWKQTSYNNNFRNIYAGEGMTYNSELDRFVPPKPFPSWIYDSVNNSWNSPVPNPYLGDDSEGVERFATWDEENQTWIPPEA